MARLAACLLLVSSAILATLPVLGQGIQQGAVVRFSPPSLEIDLPKDHIVLSYKNWLGGRGVDVYYDTSKPCKHGTATIKVIDTYAYECVDLAARLYCKVGYNNFRRSDGTPVGTASDLVNAEEFQTPKGDRLRFYPNNSSADRPPAPGDLLVFHPSGQNGYAGHVAVVNWVAGDTLMDSQRPPLEPGQRRAVGGFHAQVHRPDDLGAAMGWAGQWEVDPVCDGRSGVCLCTCMEDAESRTTRVMTLTLG
jgi:hypothetical protein